MFYEKFLQFRTMRGNVLATIIVFFLSVQMLHAQVVLNEIMYDLSGTDTGREWVELANTSGGAVTIATSTWKFFESNTNHGLTLVRGSMTLPVGGIAVIASDATKFLADNPSFSGSLFDSAFSLGNESELIGIKSDATTFVDKVTYQSAWGAQGDGNSLQLIGGIWKSAVPSAGAPNGSSGASNTLVTSSVNTASNSSTTASSVGGNSNWPVDPQIFSRITTTRTILVGADTLFSGSAAGIEKQPLDNARYVWNFGDGSTKEGQNVTHAYNFPAEYVVILDVSSGKFSAESKVTVTAVPAELSFEGVVAGQDGKIELVNKTNLELDLSWWQIKSGAQVFVIPKNTIMLARARVPFSAHVLGFTIDDTDLELLYPNGIRAYGYEAEPVVAPRVDTAPINRAFAPDSATSIASQKNVVPRTVEIQTASVLSASVDDSASPAATAITGKVAHPALAPTKAKGPSRAWQYVLGLLLVVGIVALLVPRKKELADGFTIIK